ncbi:hypothetical protein Tco_0334985 [Tanacetum coccineum]
MGPFFILDKLAEVAESSCLTDKMKVMFDQARKEEASLEALMHDIVLRDSVMLADLEQLLAHAQVGLGLKDGYLGDVGENTCLLQEHPGSNEYVPLAGVPSKNTGQCPLQEHRAVMNMYPSQWRGGGVRDVVMMAMMWGWWRRWGWWRWCVAVGVRRRCGGGEDDGSGLMMKRVVVMWWYSGDGVGWVPVMRR